MSWVFELSYNSVMNFDSFELTRFKMFFKLTFLRQK